MISGSTGYERSFNLFSCYPAKNGFVLQGSKIHHDQKLRPTILGLRTCLAEEIAYLTNTCVKRCEKMEGLKEQEKKRGSIAIHQATKYLSKRLVFLK